MINISSHRSAWCNFAMQDKRSALSFLCSVSYSFTQIFICHIQRTRIRNSTLFITVYSVVNGAKVTLKQYLKMIDTNPLLVAHSMLEISVRAAPRLSTNLLNDLVVGMELGRSVQGSSIYQCRGLIYW